MILLRKERAGEESKQTKSAKVDGGKIERSAKKKVKEEEETSSLKMKRKPPKELMKGGIRDRSLVSWIRILG